MQIKQKLCDDIVDDNKLDQAESVFGGKLPQSYREFLKENNGGRPTSSQFHFVSNEGTPEDSTIQYFFALYDGRTGSLYNKMEVYRNRVPAGHLPIACDPFGNLILIPIMDERDVAVYFWDHENESDREPTFANVSLIADSFINFIKSLK
jgi:SMI1-KNR4 cell-wall